MQVDRKSHAGLVVLLCLIPLARGPRTKTKGKEETKVLKVVAAAIVVAVAAVVAAVIRKKN